MFRIQTVSAQEPRSTCLEEVAPVGSPGMGAQVYLEDILGLQV